MLIRQGKIIKVKDRAFNDQRYFICDQKLASLGWIERTSWEDGLKRTIDWYLKHGFSSYWEHGDVEVRVLAVLAPRRDCAGLLRT
jgi:UDP-glucose 4,6-dehydratase